MFFERGEEVVFIFQQFRVTEILLSESRLTFFVVMNLCKKTVNNKLFNSMIGFCGSGTAEALNSVICDFLVREEFVLFEEVAGCREIFQSFYPVA